MKIEQFTNTAEAHPKEYAEARTFLSDLFASKDAEKIEDFYSEIKAFAPVAGLDADDTVAKLREAMQSATAEEFTARSFDILKKLVDTKVENRELMEKIRRERIIENSGNIQLSELMYYNLDLQDGAAMIHVAPRGALGFGDVLRAFREGLKELARQIREDERIKEVRAISWIVASHPGLLEKAGFTVEGAIDEKMRIEHFSDESRPVSLAHMSREEFLKRYSVTEE